MAENLPEGEEITEYTQDGFVDLCRGPHLQDTKPIRAFKLTSIAGAYWRGDSQNTMLTRIYGTAFFSPQELEELPAPARGGAPARPSPARRPARPLPLLGRLARLAVLASEGHGDLERADGVLARAEREARATARCARRSSSTPSCGSARGTGTTTARTCSSRGRRPRLRPQADELPGPRRDLQPRAPQLPRAADPARRAGARPPQRGLRRDARAHARAPHHAGRRAHLLHLGAGRGRGDRLPRARRLHLRDARPARARRALDAPRQAHRQRGAVGSHGGRARARRSPMPAGTTA